MFKAQLVVHGIDEHSIPGPVLAFEQREREAVVSCFWTTRLSGRAP